MVTGRIRNVNNILTNKRVNVYSTDLTLNQDKFLSTHDLDQIFERMMMLLTIKDIHLISRSGITDLNTHHETVELGFGQRKSPFIFNRVLRCHDHKRIW